jgi:hypothetical protein
MRHTHADRDGEVLCSMFSVGTILKMNSLANCVGWLLKSSQVNGIALLPWVGQRRKHWTGDTPMFLLVARVLICIFFLMPAAPEIWGILELCDSISKAHRRAGTEGTTGKGKLIGVSRA